MKNFLNLFTQLISEGLKNPEKGMKCWKWLTQKLRSINWRRLYLRVMVAATALWAVATWLTVTIPEFHEIIGSFFISRRAYAYAFSLCMPKLLGLTLFFLIYSSSQYALYSVMHDERDANIIKASEHFANAVFTVFLTTAFLLLQLTMMVAIADASAEGLIDILAKASNSQENIYWIICGSALTSTVVFYVHTLYTAIKDLPGAVKDIKAWRKKRKKDKNYKPQH